MGTYDAGKFWKMFECNKPKCEEERMSLGQPHDLRDETEHFEDDYQRLEKLTQRANI